MKTEFHFTLPNLRLLKTLLKQLFVDEFQFSSHSIDPTSVNFTNILRTAFSYKIREH